ncbi:hypothetical protein [uncultured Tissierella sp.]|uniref:hypothetical protein n=1 Tax=uncultured Tissierella sp. TaxID=448160 RepID=UPI002805C099|nr:hypothetical protein [uncultured Tissierella sp.]MDU5080219.1 hypothetical protein [Bacillota bacterium]
MSSFIYEKVGFVDHTTERPGVYKEVILNDGSILHVPDEGEILDKGTPVNARTLGHMEDGIYKTSILASENRDLLINHSVRLAVLEGNAMNNIGHNMFIVNFANLDSVELAHGVYDPVGKRMVI